MMGWRGIEHTPIDRRCPLWETQGIEKPDWRRATGEHDAARRLALAKNRLGSMLFMRMLRGDG